MALIKKTGWGCIFFFLSLFISPRYYIIYLMVNSRPLFLIKNQERWIITHKQRMLWTKYKGHLLFILGYLIILSLCSLNHLIRGVSTYHTGGVSIVALFICHIFYSLNVPLWGASEDVASNFKKLSCAVCLWVVFTLPALHADDLIGPQPLDSWFLLATLTGVCSFISLQDGRLYDYILALPVSLSVWAFATHKADGFKYVMDSLSGISIGPVRK